MPNFGPLRPEDVEVKVNEVTLQGATFNLYKTATVDQLMLEEKYPGKWQISHEVVFRPNGSEEVRSIIKIYNDELKEWMTFDNVGDEQQGDDAIKKQFTDADKRAGFACGIGIELKQIPYEFKFPFELLGDKAETHATNDFGQELFRIPNKDLVVTELTYDNKDSIRRKIVEFTVKCVSSKKFFTVDLRKDPDIVDFKVVKDAATEKPKRGRKTTKATKANATNCATPTLVSPSETTEAKTEEATTIEEPTLEAFMNISDNVSDEVPFDEATPTASTPLVEEEVHETPTENNMPEEEVTPLTPPVINTPKYDESDPGSAFVLYGKFKRQGARVRDLKPQEARYLYTNPAADDGLKEAIRLYALSNEEFENDFISRGIPLAKAQ